MYRAKLYSESSLNQRSDAAVVFGEFLQRFKEQKFQRQLDVGCGPGDTLVDIIIPKLFPRPVEVVGVDISYEMIKLAIAAHESGNLKFFVNDIQSDFDEIYRTLGDRRFDLISSIYCHHWVRNERQALSNIYKLMNFGGKLVMIFPVQHPFYDVILVQSKKIKYSEYLDDAEIKKFITQYYFEKNPVLAMRSRLGVAGFHVLHGERRDMSFTFKNLEHIQTMFRTINPFKMPEDVRIEFEHECSSRVAACCEQENIVQYSLMIVFASKGD